MVRQSSKSMVREQWGQVRLLMVPRFNVLCGGGARSSRPLHVTSVPFGDGDFATTKHTSPCFPLLALESGVDLLLDGLIGGVRQFDHIAGWVAQHHPAGATIKTHT